MNLIFLFFRKTGVKIGTSINIGVCYAVATLGIDASPCGATNNTQVLFA